MNHIEHTFEMDLSVANAISIVGKLLGFILLVVAYVYINKLEKTGCECSVHPYRESIHRYLTFAIVYFVITVFFPPSVAIGIFGPVGGIAYVIIDIIFTIVSLVFFILMMRYIKFLSVEKCKCSEGNTREILYIYSVVEVVILSLLVVLPILTTIIKGAFALAISTVEDVKSKTGTVTDAVFNPLKAVRQVPRTARRDFSDIISGPGAAVKGVSKVLRGNRR
jgi:hypothetical protein